MVLVVLVMAVAAVKSGVGEVTVMVMVGWLDPIGFRMISRKSIPRAQRSRSLTLAVAARLKSRFHVEI